jgi:L-ascorbate metabolism protein UlaG (beta-lactamase superfamily)
MSISPSRRRFLIGAIAAGALAGTAAGAAAFLSGDEFGGVPSGKRLERLRASPNWRDGGFRNLEPMRLPEHPKSQTAVMRDFFFGGNPRRKPSVAIPSVKTDLASLGDNRFVWLGHSGIFLRFAGLRILIDPALTAAFPTRGFFEPFRGADIYRPEDMPEADFLIITHDHYDHLDYRTVSVLRGKVKHAVMPLGVGAHFERWGWEADRITELDWWESTRFGGLTLTCVPSQHFSGRRMTGPAAQTLWAGFVLQGGGTAIYHSGDSATGGHFAKIAEAFGPLDLAFLENGQYDADWPGVHLLPEDWKKTAAVLNAKSLVTIHNSKYCLCKHAWDDPLKHAEASARELGLHLLTPRIGEPLPLDGSAVSTAWWEGLEPDQVQKTA